MSELAGRVAIITGGAGGIGSATARLLASDGVAVVIADIDEENAISVAASIRADDGRAMHVVTDVAQEGDVKRMVDVTVETYGRLDILHNNAANTSPEISSKDTVVGEMTAEVWDAMFAVNVRGPMLACKYALPHLVKSESGGVIVNTSSGASMTGMMGVRSAYGPSKAALNTLTLYLAAQYGEQNIRCNAIVPGLVITPHLSDIFSDQQIEELKRLSILPGATGPADIAAMVRFLCSDEAKRITGQLITVNGGRRPS